MLFARRPGRDDHRQRRRDVVELVQPADGAVLSRRSPTTNIRTGSTAASRKAVRPALLRAARPARSSARDWRTVGLEEYGYVAPDPLDPNIIYGGKLTRFDKRTGQVQNIMPEAVRTGKYRFLRTAPVIFSPVDPHMLYFAGNVLFKTTDRRAKAGTSSARTFRARNGTCPQTSAFIATNDMETMPRRGVIYTVAPSYKDVNTIWAGTDDGLIHVTRNGGTTWQNVTPPELKSWAKVSLIDAGRFDANTAYAAINTFPPRRSRPHILRTHDGGKTWKEIVNGLPDGGIVNAVREDPDPQRAAVLRHRTGRLFFDRRRRKLAAAAAQYAGDIDPRSCHARR